MKSIHSTIFLFVLAFGWASCDSGLNSKKEAPTSFPASAGTPATPVNEVKTPAQQVPAAQPAANTNTSTAGKKLNPAHGQPGHRCDIPVGTPLDAPATVTPATITPVSTQGTNATPPPVVQPQKNVKLNPAHGQPGHDCAIPVGQPLKS